MKIAAFNAVCPLEIGDKVIIRNEGKVKTAYYIPPETKVHPLVYHSIAGSGERATITDIAAINYCRSGKIRFQYELDNSGWYEQMDIVIIDNDLRKYTK